MQNRMLPSAVQSKKWESVGVLVTGGSPPAAEEKEALLVAGTARTTTAMTPEISIRPSIEKPFPSLSLLGRS